MIINVILGKKDLLFREILKNHNGNQGHQVNGSKKPKDSSKPIVRQTVDKDLWSSKHKFSKNVITPYPVNDDFFRKLQLFVASHESLSALDK